MSRDEPAGAASPGPSVAVGISTTAPAIDASSKLVDDGQHKRHELSAMLHWLFSLSLML
jgi:hypothetical protein